MLNECGIPIKPVRLIKVCLNETYRKVRMNKNLSAVPIQNGVKQVSHFSGDSFVLHEITSFTNLLSVLNAVLFPVNVFSWAIAKTLKVRSL
jgi:hypothetical protein